RPQAGPLPAKRGEIGYVEGQDTEERSPSPDTILPARHPADREALASTPNPVPTVSTPSTTTNHTIASPSTSTLVSTTNSTTKRKRILHFLKPKKVPSVGGLLLTTLITAILQILLMGGCIAGWVLAAKRLSRDNFGVGIGSSSAIFVHVLFGVTILGQLLFLERRIFRLRAQRYSYLHPGQLLPSSRNVRGSDPSIAFSPWNRPPLPTYAAALAQSGVGTGDVEDHLIAAQPPPAYGNTRGSTMLLAGYLRDSLRAQRPRSGESQASHGGERPLSYVSRDEQWDEIQDAERARRLEETLSRLE
ncbi:hypothetical protein BDZ94DRAFT_1139041, partial [Collybia nuda]